MRRSVVAATAAVALLAAACQSDDGVHPIDPDDQAVEPSEPEEPEPEPEDDEPEDPFAVPDEIDVAYAQRVFDELFRIEGDAYRLTRERLDEIDGNVPTEALDLLRSTSETEEYFADSALALQRAVDREFMGLVDPPADRQLNVEELIGAEGSCIVAAGDVDFRATALDPAREVVPHAYALHRDADANTTGWVFHRSTALIDDAEPYDPEEVCP